MVFESQPQTPTSPKDNLQSLSTATGTETSSISVVREKNTGDSSSSPHQRSSSRESSTLEDQPRAKEPLKPSSSLPDVVQGFSR
ncbi:hypothetical protein E2C01_074821 [Portunus trituberculatus]|uniref:Uncharacterized protein n=1 Tax=Portunus trituberculatus TaxID=210409 RepID=A0A5B7IFA1_PORTR|nr:hypothetical protein [Portunus trituberculatus]